MVDDTCEYLFDVRNSALTPQNFNVNFNSEDNISFSVSHINVRSLNKNFDSLRLFYEDVIQTNFSIIGISEVWNISNINVRIGGFT